uniref:NADH dehydrogenase subunit 2 n=1 Tax=Agrilus sichuanus TaxID=2946725 RepID=UPI00207AEF92|nr:NADH dehydrogenase subunit 2 [Agrilus sichuanus]URN73050.1 NADH dehydrogenase subunit 2 [Agrilus sichuanus]
MQQLYKILFMMTLISGTLISISSNSWLGVWIGLEMNLLSIIPLMNINKKAKATEASMKYFIVQAMASIILMMALLTNTIKSDFTSNLLIDTMNSLLMTTALLIKTGAAPFHFWFPEVMEGLEWTNALILLTWQKIAPMAILSYINLNENLIIVTILTSTIVGGIMGINQTSMRKILSFSSINHIGWMLAAMLYLETLWMWYFIIYSMMNILLVWALENLNISSISQLLMLMKLNPQLKMFFMFNFFSLGGVPPFIGFLPKWLTVQALIFNYMYFTAITLILITLVTLYFYMRMALPSISLSAYSQSSVSMNQQFKNKNFTLWNSALMMSLTLATLTFNWI